VSTPDIQGVMAAAMAAEDARRRESRPSYGAPEVGGPGYPLGIAQPARRHVVNLGPDGLLIEPRADGSNDAVQLVSPAAAPRRGLLGRLAARLRRR